MILHADRASWLIITSLTISVAVVFAAGAAILVASQQANRERDALIRIACADLHIRERNHTRLAAQWRAAYDRILADLGENPCPPVTKGATP